MKKAKSFYSYFATISRDPASYLLGYIFIREMTDFTKISEQMRADWDRRVAHDYRFWMTEAHADDAAMWSSGERDASVLLNGIEDMGSKSILEIGCGVGRMLKAVAGKFKHAVGFDISKEAIKKAKEFLGNAANAELHVGDGFTLQPMKDASLDVVYSFAAITSMPQDIAVNYILEANRVLKPGGALRMQMYLGEEQLVTENDTLHLRCFKKENLIAAIEAAGFSVEFINELVLPFQVSFKDIGIEAVVVSFQKNGGPTKLPSEISKILMPAGEIPASEMTGREIECWMSLNYAKDLAEKGDVERAKEALVYAQTFVKSCTIDVSDLLQRVVDSIEKKSKSPEKQKEVLTASESDGQFYAENIKVLNERFPQMQKVLQTHESDSEMIKVHQTAQGKVIHQKGVCLDHPEKPVQAAVAWVKRLTTETRFQSAEKIAIFGFGCGYHIEELLKENGKKVSVIEPSVDVFKMALHSRDLRAVIAKVDNLNIGKSCDLKWLDSEIELFMRPQTQSLHSELAEKVKSIFYGKRGLSTLKPSIAVVGPMQGGTLPIMGYCLRGLLSLGQRTRVIDVSNFAGGYHALENIIFDKTRQNTIQGSYVEMMSQVVLESVSEKPVDIVICMAQAPLTGRALTELKKRGIITVLWFVEDYLRFTYWKDLAQYYDFVFTIQKGPCLQAIKSAGAGHVNYLPVGCDPIIHTPMNLTAEEKARWGSPISFVGAGYHNRQQMLAALCEYPFKIWGTEWPNCKPFDRILQEEGRRLTPEEYTKIFNATDININLHSSSERDGVDPYGDFVNPRTFELASCGAFQLCDQRQLLPEAFEYETEIPTFTSIHELKEKIDYYLHHKEERQQIAQKARSRVLNEHTYLHRLKEMMSMIFAAKYEQLRERTESSPWKKMIARAKGNPELEKRCQDAFQRGEEPILDGLIADIVSGKGKLSDTEQKLLFLYHIKKQIIRAKAEEGA